MNGSIDLRDASAVIDVVNRATAAMRDSPLRQHSIVRLPPRGRLLATGDLHDNPIHLQKIIKLARLDQSPDHHVVLHEMIHSERLVNGMDFSHRMLIKVAHLLLQYPTQVHPILANHELAQLTGKGISKGAGNSVVLFDDGLAFAFGDEWQSVAESLKSFVAAMAIAVVGGDERGCVFCAHSLPPPHMMHRFDSQLIDRDLQPDDYVAPFGAAHLMVWGRDHTAEQIEELAATWNVKLFCIGHEHADTGVEIIHRRLIVLNSDHDRAVAVPIDLATIPEAEEALLSAIPLSAVAIE